MLNIVLKKFLFLKSTVNLAKPETILLNVEQNRRLYRDVNKLRQSWCLIKKFESELKEKSVNLRKGLGRQQKS